MLFAEGGGEGGYLRALDWIRTGGKRKEGVLSDTVHECQYSRGRSVAKMKTIDGSLCIHSFAYTYMYMDDNNVFSVRYKVETREIDNFEGAQSKLFFKLRDILTTFPIQFMPVSMDFALPFQRL